MGFNCLPFQPLLLWVVYFFLYLIFVFKCLISCLSKFFIRSSFESTLPWEPCNSVSISDMILSFFLILLSQIHLTRILIISRFCSFLLNFYISDLKFFFSYSLNFKYFPNLIWDSYFILEYWVIVLFLTIDGILPRFSSTDQQEKFHICVFRLFFFFPVSFVKGCGLLSFYSHSFCGQDLWFVSTHGDLLAPWSSVQVLSGKCCWLWEGRRKGWCFLSSFSLISVRSLFSPLICSFTFLASSLRRIAFFFYSPFHISFISRAIPLWACHFQSFTLSHFSLTSSGNYKPFLTTACHFPLW